MVVNETIPPTEGKKRKRTHDELEKWLRSYSVEVFPQEKEKERGEMDFIEDDDDCTGGEQFSWRLPPLYRRDGAIIAKPITKEIILDDHQKNNKNNQTQISNDNHSMSGMKQPTPTLPSPVTIPRLSLSQLREDLGDSRLIFVAMPLSPDKVKQDMEGDKKKVGGGASDGEGDSESDTEKQRERRRLLLMKISTIAQQQQTKKQPGRAQQVRSMSEWKAFMKLHTLYDQQQEEEKVARAKTQEEELERNRKRLWTAQRNSDTFYAIKRVPVPFFPPPPRKNMRKKSYNKACT